MCIRDRIQTAVPGLQVSSLMPRMARIADKYTVLRSMWAGSLHWTHSALPYMLTGNARTPNTLAYPTMGSVVAKVKGGPADMPNYIAPVSYTHLRAHETPEHLVCRLL